MHSAKASLGFIGLGVMGRPMVSHLAGAGHPVTIHDRVAGLAEAMRRINSGESVSAIFHDVPLSDRAAAE